MICDFCDKPGGEHFKVKAGLDVPQKRLTWHLNLCRHCQGDVMDDLHIILQLEPISEGRDPQVNQARDQR